MLTPILITIAVIIVLFVIIVAMQPATFSVSRSATVSAPPAVVFAQVNDLHKWEAWNPWGKLDPAMKTSYEGAAAGPGAKYSWTGSAKVGTGSMTITDSRPGELVRLKLEFLKPFKATNTAEFTFKPEGNQTVVTWAMTGNKNFVSKAMCLFVSMDKMCGGAFEKGLADMKKAAEAA
jgi:Polyketide cyclase / dehydrase and lipid transport